MVNRRAARERWRWRYHGLGEPVGRSAEV